MLYTQGVVSVEDDPSAGLSEDLSKLNESVVSTEVSPILAAMIDIPDGEAWKYSPAELYRRYGARPAKTQTLPYFAGSGAQLVEDANENMNYNNLINNNNNNESGGEGDVNQQVENGEQTIVGVIAGTVGFTSSDGGKVENNSKAGGNRDGNNEQNNNDTPGQQTNDTGNNNDDDDDDDDNESGDDNSKTPTYILPYLYALYEFMYQWSQQFQVNIDVTFMPEVFPGSRIRIDVSDSLWIEAYVDKVSHTMSYTSGFNTKLSCICPIGNLVSGFLNPDSSSKDIEKYSDSIKKKK